MPVQEWGAQPPVGIDAGFDWTFVTAWCQDDGSSIDPAGWTAELTWVDGIAADITTAPQIVVDSSEVLDFGPDAGQGTFTVTVTTDGTYTSTLADMPRGAFRIVIHGPQGQDDLLIEVPVEIN